MNVEAHSALIPDIGTGKPIPSGIRQTRPPRRLGSAFRGPCATPPPRAQRCRLVVSRQRCSGVS